MRAALSLALGACESHGGPTCIVGDPRRNQRLAEEEWAGNLEQINTVSEEAEAASEEAPVDGEEEYPDL